MERDFLLMKAALIRREDLTGLTNSTENDEGPSKRRYGLFGHMTRGEKQSYMF